MPDEVVLIDNRTSIKGGTDANKVTYKNNDTESTSGKQQVDPWFDLVMLDVESGRDDTAFIQSTVQLYNNLAGAMVVDQLELADVALKKS